MKTIIVFLCVCLATAYCQASIGPSIPGTPPGKCNSKEHGLMNVGDEKQPKDRCVKISCLKDGYIQSIGCGVVATPPNCKVIKQDKNTPHPECCQVKFDCSN